MIQRNNKFVRFFLEIKYGKPLQWFWSWNTIDYVSAICSFLQQLGIFTLLSSLTSYEARVCFETRVWVRDSAIFEKIGCRCGGTWQLKNYLKYFYLYFLYIFTIKIFLKNTLLWPWFTKQRKKKARNTSKVRISAVPMSFKADFSHFRPVSAVSTASQYDPIRPNSGRISPVRRESKPIRRESSGVGTNQAESVRIQWKKKKTQTRH